MLIQNFGDIQGVSWEMCQMPNEAFSHDVTAAMLVIQINPLGVKLFSDVNVFFCSNKFA